MNTQPNDGGPAFPITQLILAADGSVERVVISPGMTLRNYMIIHAPASEVDSLIPDSVGEITKWLGVENYTFREHYPMALAKARGIWADAMLSARERKEGA